MAKKHIIFSTERLPKMLLEAASLLIEVDNLNKQTEAMEQPYIFLRERKQKVDYKVKKWLSENIVETD